jgi:hypothetical protein
MQHLAYVVIPFTRNGAHLGPSQAIVFQRPQQARLAASQIARRVAGVAILERQIDPETGDEQDRLVAEIGAVPPSFPETFDWSMRLN